MMGSGAAEVAGGSGSKRFALKPRNAFAGALAVALAAANIESSAAMSSPAGKHGIGSMGMCTLSVNDFNEFGDVSRNL